MTFSLLSASCAAHTHDKMHASAALPRAFAFLVGGPCGTRTHSFSAFETAASTSCANGPHPNRSLFLPYYPTKANFRHPLSTSLSHSFHTTATPLTAQPQRRSSIGLIASREYSWGKNGCVTSRVQAPALNWKDGAVAFRLLAIIGAAWAAAVSLSVRRRRGDGDGRQRGAVSISHDCMLI